MPMASFDDSDATRHPAARFLHPLGSSLSGAPRDALLLSFCAVDRQAGALPKHPAATTISSRLSPLLPDAIERPEDLPEFADLYCTPSAT
jgi:hypothetical protein